MLASWIRTEPLAAVLIVIALTLPLEFTQSWFPVGSVDVARLGMVVAFCLAVLQVVRRREITRPPWLLLAAVGGVLAVEALSVAVFRWPSGVRSLVGVAAFAVFAGVVVQGVRDVRVLRLVVLALVVSTAVEGVLLIAEQVTNVYLVPRPGLDVLGRRNGTFDDPNNAARLLLIGLGATLAWAATSRLSDRLRVVWAGMLVALSLGLVLTLSRTSWLLMALVLVVWVLSTVRSVRAAVGPAIVCGAFVIGLVVVPNALGRASDIPPADDGTALQVVPGDIVPDPHPSNTILDPILRAAPIDEVRRYLARAGTSMFEVHPILGVGLGGFQPKLLGPYRDFIPTSRGLKSTSLPHTDVIRIAAEEGLVGLAAWAAFLAALLLSLRRAASRIPPGLAVALGLAGLVILVASQSEGRFYTDPYLWLVVGLIGAAARFERESPEPAILRP